MVKMVKIRKQTVISRKRRSSESILGVFRLKAKMLTSTCRLLLIYSVTCQGELTKSQKDRLQSWIQTEKSRHGEKELLEKWGISRQEYASLVGKLLTFV